jgi:hypothetical protein
VNKSGNNFNVDETGLQLNNKPRYVLAKRGPKDLHLLKYVQKGETMSVITCCSAEGHFLPAVSILNVLKRNKSLKRACNRASPLLRQRIQHMLHMKYLCHG